MMSSSVGPVGPGGRMGPPPLPPPPPPTMMMMMMNQNPNMMRMRMNPHTHHQQQQQQVMMRSAAPPPPSNVVLLCHVPQFLGSTANLREWILPCGTARTILWFPNEPLASSVVNTTSSNSSSPKNQSINPPTAPDSIQTETSDNPSSSSNTMALVTMAHGDGAYKLVCAYRHMMTTTTNTTTTTDGQDTSEHFSVQSLLIGDSFRAHLVPPSPEIPLDTPRMDESTTRAIADQLSDAWKQLQLAHEQSLLDPLTIPHNQQDSHDNQYQDGPDTQQVHNTSSATEAAATAEDASSLSLLDADKVAAAAGGAGNYDEDADPLNAPAVLEAVRQFRQQLQITTRRQKQRRIELVQQQLQKALPEMRQRLERERQDEQQARIRATETANPPFHNFPEGMPPPPPPPLPPLPLEGLPPPPPPPTSTLLESGRRGVSNLPAWMTKDQPPTFESLPPPPQLEQHQQQPEGPPRKRPKLDVPIHNTSTNFPQVPESQRSLLRAFIASQIQDYLGEEELTLIEFCLNHVMEGRTYKELLDELSLVLEEDAPVFVEALKQKVLQGF